MMNDDIGRYSVRSGLLQNPSIPQNQVIPHFLYSTYIPQSPVSPLVRNGGQGNSCYFGDLIGCISLPTILRQTLSLNLFLTLTDTCHWLLQELTK